MLMPRTSDVVKVFAHFCTAYYNRYVLVMLPNASKTRGGIYGLRIHEQMLQYRMRQRITIFVQYVQSENEGGKTRLGIKVKKRRVRIKQGLQYNNIIMSFVSSMNEEKNF